MDRTQLNTGESIQDLVSSIVKIRDYLQPEDESIIHRQFGSSSWKPNCQVLWSGMLREQAQTWADERNLQTLTTAMGPLMDPRTPTCPYSRMSSPAWSRYVHGASAVFAWHIAKGEVVTVLCPPPPQRFHPSGRAYYQTIEEPILRAAITDGATLRIDLVHPRVHGAEDYRYQFLPHDEMDAWVAIYGTTDCRKCAWRMIKGYQPQVSAKSAIKHFAAASGGSEKADVQVPAAVKKAVTCQQTSSKKSKKKKKKKGRKQASCATTVAKADAAHSPKAKQQVKTVKGASTYTPGPAKSKATNINPCPGTKVRPSKRERKAQNAIKANANTRGTAANIPTKKSHKSNLKASKQSDTSIATVKSSTPKLTTAQKRKAKKLRKKAREQAKKANQQATQAIQAKKQAKQIQNSK